MPIEHFTCTLKGTPSGDQVSTRLDSCAGKHRCRARFGGSLRIGRCDTGVVCAGRRTQGAAFRGAGPVPRVLRGLASCWQARHRRRLCWQAQHFGALDRCRVRFGSSLRVGKHDTGVVCAGRRSIYRGPGPVTRALPGLASRRQARHKSRLCRQAQQAFRGPGPVLRALGGLAS